ncbi:hypothetical protein [Asticcacaulis sp. AC460]|uniref:hypothetical protein n=1 Tax=Asticcacaulis sp. AC460 TaxID=1282360 RepID=UPI0012DED33D|nr:hypothetical protein [Asticcacaulis sp. AC460]
MQGVGLSELWQQTISAFGSLTYLDIYKIASPIGAGLFGLLGFATRFWNDSAKRITFSGLVATLGVTLSIAAGVTANVFEFRKEQVDQAKRDQTLVEVERLTRQQTKIVEAQGVQIELQGKSLQVQREQVSAQRESLNSINRAVNLINSPSVHATFHVNRIQYDSAFVLKPGISKKDIPYSPEKHLKNYLSTSSFLSVAFYRESESSVNIRKSLEGMDEAGYIEPLLFWNVDRHGEIIVVEKPSSLVTPDGKNCCDLRVSFESESLKRWNTDNIQSWVDIEKTRIAVICNGLDRKGFCARASLTNFYFRDISGLVINMAGCETDHSVNDQGLGVVMAICTPKKFTGPKKL